MDHQGRIAQTAHPAVFGAPLMHPEITLDFSEALIELVTAPVTGRVSDLVRAMTQLTQYTAQCLEQQGEWLNAGSMPTLEGLDPETEIPLAHFGSSGSALMKHAYRRGLSHRYGKRMQVIAGIHFNLSYPDVLFEVLKRRDQNIEPLEAYRSSAYMAMVRRFFSHAWMIPYLFGVSPVCDLGSLGGKTYPYLVPDHQKRAGIGAYATSLRLSDIGYQNHPDLRLNISYRSVQSYAESLKAATHQSFGPFETIPVVDDQGVYQQLNTHGLQVENEFYNPIRPKQIMLPGERPATALERRGVAYLEMRLLDLHPAYEAGQSLETYAFIDLLMLYCFLETCDPIHCETCTQAREDLRQVVSRGRDPHIQVTIACGRQMPIREAGALMIERLRPLARYLDHLDPQVSYLKALEIQREKFEDPSKTPSQQWLQGFQSQGLSYGAWNAAHTHALHNKLLSLPELPHPYLARQEALAEHSQRQLFDLERSPQLSLKDYLGQYFGKD